MTRAQREHPAAVTEIDNAVRWYEEQEQGVGAKLIDRAEDARREISEWPEAGQPVMTISDGTVIRSQQIRRFPYSVIYAVDRGGGIILAYAYQRRRPRYWLDRVRPGTKSMEVEDESTAYATRAGHRLLADIDDEW